MTLDTFRRFVGITLFIAAVSAPLHAQPRLVLIDQDGSGPGDSNQLSLLLLLQSPQVDVLGITMVSGNVWRDEGVQHTLRMLELIGRTDVPVARGAVFPLVRTQENTRRSFATTGRPFWLGAWGGRQPAAPDAQIPGPYEIPPLPEGAPSIKPVAEDAAHFLVRQVRAHPGAVTVYAAGPLTNIARAIALDPKFVGLTRGIVLMGGSIAPQTVDPDYLAYSRFEFNFWFDPDAAHRVLRAPWPRIDVTTVDVSIRAMFTDAMYEEIARGTSPTARYVANWSTRRYYQWDELAAAAWIDPSLITRTLDVYMDVDVTPGPSYGHTLTWSAGLQPTGARLVHAQLDADVPRFSRRFVELMTASPQAPRPSRTPR